MKDDPNRPLIVQRFSPIPPLPEKDERGSWHGGLKVDWRSEVGRMGDLLEWVVPVRSVDAGMPPDVARIFAAALCSVATVAGCTGRVPDHFGPSWTTVAEGHMCRLSGRWWQRPRYVGILASQDPSVVAELFDGDHFIWSLENQLLFLSPPNMLPRLNYEVVGACFAVPIEATPAQLTAAGVIGLVRAGVDGDVAGLYVLAPEWRARIVRALADATRASGARWEEYSGAEYWRVHPPAQIVPD